MVRAISTALRPKRRQFKIPVCIAFCRFRNSRKLQLPNRRRTSKWPPAQENYVMESPRNEEENGVLKVFREEQLGRNIFLLAVPISTGVVAYYNPVSISFYSRLVILAISIGSTAIWNGILLRRAWPRVSAALELAGVSFMLLAFFAYLSSRLPDSFIWLPLLCFFLSLVPIMVGAAFFCRASRPPENADVPAATAAFSMV